tara:strand:+ start:1054 stop:1680 length:627 start_codon:yes stop_codon:yes gene_type:complete
MATKLALYNAALVEIGVARIVTITDAVKGRYELDVVYDNVLADCLKDGQWNFAMRTVQGDAGVSVPAFGYLYQFAKPSDWVRTVAFSADTNLSTPILDYEDQGGVWLASADPIYVRYVSSDASYGGDLTLFPPDYRRFVELSLAARVCNTLTGNASLRDRLVERDVPKAMKTARSHDAMDGPTKFLPPGRFVAARGGGRSNDQRRAAS